MSLELLTSGCLSKRGSPTLAKLFPVFLASLAARVLQLSELGLELVFLELAVFQILIQRTQGILVAALSRGSAVPFLSVHAGCGCAITHARVTRHAVVTRHAGHSVVTRHAGLVLLAGLVFRLSPCCWRLVVRHCDFRHAHQRREAKHEQMTLLHRISRFSGRDSPAPTETYSNRGSTRNRPKNRPRLAVQSASRADVKRMPSSLAMRSCIGRSSRVTSTTECPLFPARPVRPARWT